MGRRCLRTCAVALCLLAAAQRTTSRAEGESGVGGGGDGGEWEESGSEDDADAGGQSIQVLAGSCDPPVVDLTAAESVDVRVRLVLAQPLAADETLLLLFTPPEQHGGDAAVTGDAAAAIAPHLDVPAEESAGGVTLTIEHAELFGGADGAAQYEGTLTLSQWSSANGVFQLEYVMVTDSWGEARTYDTSQLPEWIRLGVRVAGALKDTTPPSLLLIDLPDVVFGGGVASADAALLSRNATIVVAETQSGLARLSAPTCLVGSHLQLRARDAPSTQLVSKHFDGAHAVDTLVARATLPASVVAALEGYPGAVAYAVNLSLPWYAWAGQWDVVGATVVDGAGNAITLSGRSLARRVAPLSPQGACFRVVNANLTFWGEDLFDYGRDDALGDDDYDQFYTEYEDYYGS